MSSLWHDVDYLPEKRLEIPLVIRGLDDMALPASEHQLPEGKRDPFVVQEKAYDVASAQMERGLAGQAFLYGATVHSRGIDPSGGAKDKQTSQHHHAQNIEKALIDKRVDQGKKVGELGLYGKKPTPSDAKKGVEAPLDAAHVAQGVGMVAGMATSASAQSIQAVGVPEALKDAIGVVGATASAAETGALGVAQATGSDEMEKPQRVERRKDPLWDEDA